MSIEEQFELTLKTQLLHLVYTNEAGQLINYQASKEVIDAEFTTHKIKIKNKTFVQLQKELATKYRNIYNKIALDCLAYDYPFPVGYL